MCKNTIVQKHWWGKANEKLNSKTMKRIFLIAGLLLVIVSYNNSKNKAKPEAPLFDNLGQHHLEITTDVILARKL